MKHVLLSVLTSSLALSFAPCFAADECKCESVPTTDIISGPATSQLVQSELTPAQVLEVLKNRNELYVNSPWIARNNSERIPASSAGQYPLAVVLSCLDSRVLVEDVFHCGIGDLFVARVAGNVVNEDILASMEFACKVSGSKVVVVLGHENCGAVRAAISGADLGNIPELLEKIEPAVDEARAGFSGNASASNPAFVQSVCTHNVEHGMKVIREESPVLAEMEAKGEIIIVGGVYDLETGKVEFLPIK